MDNVFGYCPQRGIMPMMPAWNLDMSHAS
jgi:hypothetical protein